MSWYFLYGVFCGSSSDHWVVPLHFSASSILILHTLNTLLAPGPHKICSSLCRMPLAAVGYLDGTLAIYDLSTQSLRHKCQHEVLPCTYSLSLRASLGPADTSGSPALPLLEPGGLSWG